MAEGGRAWGNGGAEREKQRKELGIPIPSKHTQGIFAPYRPRDQGMELFMCPVEHPVEEVRKLDHHPSQGQLPRRLCVMMHAAPVDGGETGGQWLKVRFDAQGGRELEAQTAQPIRKGGLGNLPRGMSAHGERCVASVRGEVIGGARLDSSTPRKLGNCEFF